MKRMIILLVALGVLSLLTDPALARGGPPHSAKMVQVNRSYPGAYHGAHYGGWYGYRAYYPPVWGHPPVVRYYPYYPPVYRSYYYHHPRSGFYYSTPGFSFRVGF